MKNWQLIKPLSGQARDTIKQDIVLNAQPSALFFAMNALAALVAGFGLLANSAAVVIGAMLIAMMLAPISGIALALISLNSLLLQRALTSLSLGLVMIVLIGVLLGWLQPEMALTPEILSRTTPNTLDLLVALCGGAAGAIATVTPRLSVAVVGVGVATALVPPLVASGILLAHARWELAAGALLLAVTNMVAIQLASSLVYWLAGLGLRRQQASSMRRFQLWLRNLPTLLLIALIGFYLSFTLNQQIKIQTRDQRLDDVVRQYLQVGNNVVVQIKMEEEDQRGETFHQFYRLISQPFLGDQVNRNKPFALVRIVIRGDQIPLSDGLREVERHLPSDIDGRPIRLQVRFVTVHVIDPPDRQGTSLSEEEAQALALSENTPNV